jgi:hypothetical protein
VRLITSYLKELQLIMKLRLLILIIPLLASSKVISQETELTQQEKVSDFLFLFETLENNYPFFGVKKRIHKIDWLNNKDEYLNRIKTTENDLEFIREIKSILNDLKDGHLSFTPTLYHSNYIKVYKQVIEKDSSDYYQPWVDELEKVKTERTKYWKTLLDSLISEKQTDKVKKPKTEKNYNFVFQKYFKNSIAYIKIKTFNYFNISKDQDTIFSFLNGISDCDNLIIDIQGNGGGSVSYWKKNLVSKLIKDTIHYKSYRAIKDGNYTENFFNHYQDERKNVINYNFENKVPRELTENEFYIIEKEKTIEPDKPVAFEGNIYLLVDNEVFSSSEGFAMFCKASNWATVVGETTKGGGGGTDPLVLALPQSGIIINFSGEMTLNPDLTINEEVKTIPDIVLEGGSQEEKLNALIELIERKLKY